MSASPSALGSLGLDRLSADASVYRDATGTLIDAVGGTASGLTPEFVRSLRHVLDRERPGVARRVLQACGRAASKAWASRLDARLTVLGKPALPALPLEASLELLVRAFAAQGWGRLTLDLALVADHGVVLATLEHSAFAEALTGANDFVDAVPAGFLEAFFAHLTGQSLSCEEIACRSRGAPQCRFVITAAARLKPLAPLIGREPAEAIIKRLRQ